MSALPSKRDAFFKSAISFFDAASTKAEAGDILVFDSVTNLLPLAFQSETLIKKK